MNDDTPTQKTSPLTTVLNIFTEPTQAFTTIKERPTKLFPMAVVLVPTVLMLIWYFSALDFEWFIEYSMRDVASDERRAAEEGMRMFGSTGTMVLGLLGACLGALLIWTVSAGYLTLISKMFGDDIGFGHWFSLSIWISVISVLGLVAGMIVMLLNPGGQVPIESVNPLTLGGIGLSSDNPGAQRLLDSFSLFVPWTVTLAVVAYRQWLSCSWQRACWVNITPQAVLFGGWALFALI